MLCGIALLPACLGVTCALLDAFTAVNRADSAISSTSAALLGGCAVWMLVWFFLPRPARSYVLAHELTHALYALLCGADVSRIRVSASGGSVSLSKSNVWITLSPYFFPFYTFVIVLFYLGLSVFVKPVPCKPLWFFLVGFTWGFHLCFTINSLLIHQPDIQVYGRIFSYVFIYFLNLSVIALWMIATTPVKTVTLAASFLTNTRSIYALIAEGSTTLLLNIFEVLR